MQAINESIENPLFFASFFGAVLFLLVALVAHFRRARSRRFWLVALACALSALTADILVGASLYVIEGYD